MDQLNWGGLALLGGSILLGVIAYPLFGAGGFIVGLMVGLFAGGPLKAVYDERRARLSELEARVDELERRLNGGSDD